MTFNLLHEPWLSVLTPEGEERKVGLREALTDAESFSDYIDPDPGVEASVLRLMLAVVHAAVGEVEGGGLLTDYPAQVIADYLDRFEDRFDLFHPDRPFFQAPHAGKFDRRTPMALAFPFLPGGSKIMVADGYAEHDDRMTPADAARYLICVQAWGNGQATSGPLPGSTNKSTPAGPLAGSLNLYVLGQTLAQTLLLNMNPTKVLGTPVWEVEPGRAPSGWAGRLAWPSRSYLLVPDDDGMVHGMHFSAGHPIPATEDRDPHLIFRDDGVYLRMTANKATWRDLPVIYGWERGGESEQLKLARDHLAAKWEDLERCVIYGRDNVGMSVASIQLRLVVPLPVKMVNAESHAQGVLTHLMKQTSDAIRALRVALDGMDPQVASQVWSVAETPYLLAIEACASAPDDVALVNEQRTHYVEAILASCRSVFEAQAVALSPQRYGMRRNGLEQRLAKAFKDDSDLTKKDG